MDLPAQSQRWAGRAGLAPTATGPTSAYELRAFRSRNDGGDPQYILWMSDPRQQDAKERPERETPLGFGANFHLPPVARHRTRADFTSPDSGPGNVGPHASDQRAARILLLVTIVGAIVVAGGIEWAGWQIVYRHADPAMVTPPDLIGIPRAQWALGMVRNAVGALGVGIGTAALAMLFPWSRKRPWRAAAAAFAVGTATVLVVLGGLTSWAP